MKKYALVRILGNELPPRDKNGNRLNSLNFILINEPDFDNCSKFWILNTIHDHILKNNIIALLENFNQNYIEFPFERKNYLKATTIDEKIRWAVNINAARNFGLNMFLDKYKFTFLFDGDCFFTEFLWRKTISDIKEDGESKKYYGVPGVRIVDKIPYNYHEMRSWEPSLVFRNDADLKFNESIPFSKNDRIELLIKIGYVFQGSHAELQNSICKNVGKLLHISFGNEDIEENLQKRIEAREKSLEKLLYHIDHMKIV